ncbi:hypothetical protein Dsin_027845 [Dipteronia sinensis]|uniref:non-specific serine/threonine protein kinase n=1 Tax=Dipteronia sinensis TaxID=43782 RepID=A0AAD9ZPN1_9ROSI|nr:hypothetical protein Dsin_027845 [Dipteronia sinensis]
MDNEISSASTTLSWLCLFSFIFFFISQSSSAADDQLHRIGWNCGRTPNNTASTTFTFNLGRLFSRKLYDEGNNSIYYQTTDGDDPDKVYGLYLCKGDVTKLTCQNCINSAIDNLIKECKGTKTAIIWFDECLVRYNNRSFASTMESQPALILSNPDNLNVTDPVTMKNALNQSFTQLIANANSNSLKFATNIVNISSSVTLYTLGQCIPDLSTEVCRVCLESAAQLLEYEKLGSRYLYPSCNTRFELYQFFRNSSADEPITPVQAPTSKTGSSADGENKVWIPVVVTVSAVVAAVLFGVFAWRMCRRHRKNEENKADSQEIRLLRLRDGRIGNNDNTYEGDQNQVESQDLPLFPLELTVEATQNFSDQNKLGEGGFGPVYKGVLADGQEIAVKRLSGTSGQGLREFKNEVTVIAKLQHKNLVRLLGCCLEGNEMLLVYEYMPNKSLDVLLFDSTRSIQLDWKTRLSIINGIARGILYLHEDSRLKIIHRDLKASNVLLDHEMNPKISDFGMAKIFGGNQIEANTNRVVGTYGYMAPEYAMEGLFSVKSDVFSFGVLLLEIISGRKNGGFYLSEHGLSLLNYTWKLWCEEQSIELIDPVLVQSCVQVDLLKYIHIGLLCVQEDPADRPIMSSIVVMLASDNMKLPQPTEPAFSVGRNAKLAQSSSDVKVVSFNEVTLSNVFPR